MTGAHKPTGQELDRQYDELHEAHDADEYPTPEGSDRSGKTNSKTTPRT
jgi:hypothetical protein